jgi:LsmAD domain/Ataxin 2 SM domain
MSRNNAWSRPFKPNGSNNNSNTAWRDNVNGGNVTTQNGHDQRVALRERFLHLMIQLVGHKVQVTCVDGTVLQGIYHTSTPFADREQQYVLKAVRVLKQQNNKYTTGATLILNMDQVVSVQVPSIPLVTGSSVVVPEEDSAFRTDTEISGTTAAGNNQHMEQVASTWITPPPAPASSRAAAFGQALSVADTTGGSTLAGSIGVWNQFDANERLQKKTVKYDEAIYTTPLDRTKFSSQQQQLAAQLAREIEGSTSTNRHVAEERGHAVQGDYDEEDLYSGVARPFVVTEKASAAPPGFAAPVEQPEATAAATALSNLTINVTPDTIDETKTETVVAVTTEKEVVPEPKEKEEAASEPVAADAAKIEPEKEASPPPEGEVSTPAATTTTSTSTSPAQSSAKPKLNPNAKAFTLSASAKTWTPPSSLPDAAAAVVPAAPPHYMYAQPGYPVPPPLMDGGFFMPPPPHMHPGMMPYGGVIYSYPMDHRMPQPLPPAPRSSQQPMVIPPQQHVAATSSTSGSRPETPLAADGEADGASTTPVPDTDSGEQPEATTENESLGPPPPMGVPPYGMPTHQFVTAAQYYAGGGPMQQQHPPQPHRFQPGMPPPPQQHGPPPHHFLPPPPHMAAAAAGNAGMYRPMYGALPPPPPPQPGLSPNRPGAGAPPPYYPGHAPIYYGYEEEYRAGAAGSAAAGRTGGRGGRGPRNGGRTGRTGGRGGGGGRYNQPPPAHQPFYPPPEEPGAPVDPIARDSETPPDA